MIALDYSEVYPYKDRKGSMDSKNAERAQGDGDPDWLNDVGIWRNSTRSALPTRISSACKLFVFASQDALSHQKDLTPLDRQDQTR